MNINKNVLHFLIVAGFFIASLSLAGAQGSVMIEAAKKEGQLAFYATMELQLSNKLAGLFEKKYPFIKTNFIRLGSERLAARVTAEAQAKSVQADVISESEMDFYGLFKKGFIDRYESPERVAFKPEYKDEKGFWTIASETLSVLAYNSNLVKTADVPKSFADLTSPKWKGKMLIDENESKWMAGVMTVWKEDPTAEFLRKLAEQDIKVIGGHSQMHTLVAAGEASIIVVSLVHGLEQKKREGAPVEWIALDPLISRQFALALAKGAPHPNAAKLYIDFMLSKEAQQEIANYGYTIGRKDVDSYVLKKLPQGMKIVPVRPEMGERYNEYFKLYRKLMKLD
ncbi:MAG: extracellular solute-binding protein [Deltaproteobacteria bacterium]|nr:extracellular solute-binding protein [Deltaproteobacteria bacterium]